MSGAQRCETLAQDAVSRLLLPWRAGALTMADVQRARDALMACDASCPRDEWVRLAMAAKAAGIDLNTFHAWSAQASSYDERDARALWVSIRQADGVGPGTLFKAAAENGWNPDGRVSHARHAQSPRMRAKRAHVDVGASQLWQRCIPASTEH